MKIGLGIDSHRLVANRPLILGGVLIECEYGLDGHSDADVVAHAISDALLGAVKLGDIGEFFPDNDSKFKDANSVQLLSQVSDMVSENGYLIEDIDCVIVAQKPKLAPFRDEMRNNLARAMKIDVNCVGLKATTTEKMGFEGRGEGISAHAVALLRQIGE